MAIKVQLHRYAKVIVFYKDGREPKHQPVYMANTEAVKQYYQSQDEVKSVTIERVEFDEFSTLMNTVW